MSRYYDPSTGRFINADVYLDTGIGIFGTNMYTYCENDPINYVDVAGYYCFKRTEKGFQIIESVKFLSRKFCLQYANTFLNRFGYWTWFGKKYSGMGALRIAQELWFHALVYYVGKPIQTILSWYNISFNWLNDKVERASVIDVNSDDDRAWLYGATWNCAWYIKSKIPLISYSARKYMDKIIL